jgi:hypothetical protein
MSVSPLPVKGGVHFDRRNAGRALRVAAHPDQGLVTLSMWRGDICVGTHQLAAEEVPELVRMLAQSLVDQAPAAAAAC